MSLFQKSYAKTSAGQNSDDKIQIALDIGSSKIRLIAGRVEHDKTVEIIGYKETVSRGVSKGAVTDIGELSATIAELIRAFNEEYGIEVKHLTVGVPSCFSAAENQEGNALIPTGIVSEEDRDQVIKSAKMGVQTLNESNYKIIHVIPQNFITETSSEIRNPVGQYAKKLSASVHFIGVKHSHLNNIRSVLNTVDPNIVIDSEVNCDNAASDAVLTESEKEIGVCHIDIGKGTVGVSVYDKKCRIFSFGFTDGGVFIDDEIARTFGIRMSQAEKVRIYSGTCVNDFYAQDQPIPVKAITAMGQQTYEVELNLSQKALNNIIYLRFVNIFRRVSQRIESLVNQYRKGEGLNLGAGFVITGGLAHTPGIMNALEMVIFNKEENSEPYGNRKFRIGFPRGISVVEGGPNIQEMSYADKSVIIGLLRCAKDGSENYLNDKRNRRTSKRKGWLEQAREWINREF